MTKEIALHCMKSASELERELCEECPIYGQTGCDHCYEDALQYVIGMLEQEPIDAVSRQAAIDAVKERITFAKAIRPNGDVFNLFESENAELEKAIANIKKLPSVNAIQHTSNASKDVEQRTNTLGDAISREAVLDGLKGCICDEWVKTLFATMVKLLPSVTPTQKNTLENTLDDAINRRASIDALKKHFSDDDGIDTECGAYWHHADVIEVLQGMPPVTPKEKTGHWIEDSDIDITGEKVYWFQCSNCEAFRGQKTMYCPDCGAKMESEVQTDAT